MKFTFEEEGDLDSASGNRATLGRSMSNFLVSRGKSSTYEEPTYVTSADFLQEICKIAILESSSKQFATLDEIKKKRRERHIRYSISGMTKIEENKQMVGQLRPTTKQEQMHHKRVNAIWVLLANITFGQVKSEQDMRRVLDKKHQIDAEKKERLAFDLIRNDIRKTVRDVNDEIARAQRTRELKQKTFIKLITLNNLCTGLRERLEVMLT